MSRGKVARPYWCEACKKYWSDDELKSISRWDPWARCPECRGVCGYHREKAEQS